MADSIESLSMELLERLSTEERRPSTTPSTQLVGGLVKSGAKLEALLRAIVQVVADADGVDPVALLAPTGGRPLTLRKAMAGPLAHGLKAHLGSRRAGPLPEMLRPILDDLTGRDSRILEFLKRRNETAKEGREPKLAQPAVRRLRELVAMFRRNAGWR